MELIKNTKRASIDMSEADAIEAAVPITPPAHFFTMNFEL